MSSAMNTIAEATMEDSLSIVCMVEEGEREGGREEGIGGEITSVSALASISYHVMVPEKENCTEERE